MYIPSFNQITDQHEAVSFMQRYSFATIVTVSDGIPVATHLPFTVIEVDDRVIISSHFARANPQAADIVNGRALVIFTEPHAYISPTHYEKETNVPTWNYLAVHAYGNCTMLHDDESKTALLKDTITYYDAGYMQQFDKLAEDYKRKMLNGIVAFKIVVDDLQAKKKLSQNRTDRERDNVIAALSQSADKNEREVAEYMEKERKGRL